MDADKVIENEVQPEPEIGPDETIDAFLRSRPRMVLRGGGLAEESHEPEVPEPEVPEPEVPEVLSEEKKPQYASIEEAERAVKEAKQRMHTATEETATFRKEREQLQQELEEARKQLAEAQKPKQLSEDDRDEIFAGALEEISNLDTDDPNYRRQAGRVWRTAMEQAGQFRELPDVESITQAALERFEAKYAEREAQRLEDQRKSDDERARDAAIELAKRHGLNMDSRIDRTLFWDIAPEIAERMPGFQAGETLLEDQVKWVVGEVKKERGLVVETTEAEREKQRKIQLQQQALGKGGTRPPATPEPDEESIASTLARQKEAQRVRR